MPSRIRVLNEQTINKIAAGEVIENPASVVKELVENALDAGSKEICIEIKGGGRQLIRVTDNGWGMNPDDALLCLERHATSKIREVEDILSVGTMGFRGEAIPSIAAVSKFTLMTCEAGSQGTMVIVEGGKIMQCTPVARSPGTTIEVKALFFNVPVRRKFQKSPSYDANEILKMVTGIALGHPLIKFELISDQKRVLSTAATEDQDFFSSLQCRAKEILGSEYVESTYPVNEEKEGIQLQGMIGMPFYTRPNRAGQYLFINQRAVFSPLVGYAVRAGYGTALPSNRHPIYVLHLTVPGGLVDVNVHPQKREVRIRQEQSLKEIVLQAVSRSLQSSKGTFDEPNFILPMRSEPQAIYFEEKISFEPLSEMPLPPPPVVRPVPPVHREAPRLFAMEEPSLTAYRVLATLKHYILAELGHGNEGLTLIDQRAAHSRVLFERMLQNRAENPQQSLLIPYNFEVTPPETALLNANLKVLNDLGISIQQTGPNGFLVDSLPSYFEQVDVPSMIRELIQHLNQFEATTSVEQERLKQLAKVASRAAISNKTRLSIMEAQALIDQLMRCQTKEQCPMGKPIIAALHYSEIAKKFGQI